MDDEFAHRRFPSTHWSIIESAGSEDLRGARPALSELLRRYSPALRAHLLMRRTVEPDQIDDVLQGFISSKLLEADLIGGADRSRGKFRTLLLTALDRFVVSEQRRGQAKKRGPGRTQTLTADSLLPTDPAGARPDPFVVEWARQILRETLDRMRAHCQDNERMDVWGVFQSRVLRPTLDGVEAVDYAQVVKQFGYRSPAQLWNAVRTGKHLFARLLRSVIAEYAPTEEQIEMELRDLFTVCARLPQLEGHSAYL